MKQHPELLLYCPSHKLLHMSTLVLTQQRERQSSVLSLSPVSVESAVLVPFGSSLIIALCEKRVSGLSRD
jgi:hypothetical protein